MLAKTMLAGSVVALSFDGAAAQYRRQAEVVLPLWGVAVSAGAVLGYEETFAPTQTTPPGDPERRAYRSVGTHPVVAVSGRYGRGLAAYARAAFGLGVEAEMSGNDPETAAPLDGTEDVGTTTMLSAGVSFVPVQELFGIRFELGPEWIDLGNGGSYIGLRVAAAATFLELADRVGVRLSWEGHIAGGEHTADGLEYRLRDGLISSVGLGVELTF